MSTTTLTKLDRIIPESETHWRLVAAKAHRIIGKPGDEAAARTHELMICEIRNSAAGGNSRQIRFCPMCLNRGSNVILLWIGGTDRCGTCGWKCTFCIFTKTNEAI
jgi:hypothetical protein